MAHECVLCNEGITNPICPECLTTQMKQWFQEKSPKYIKPLMDRLEITKSFTHDNTDCVICGQNMNICSHCFSRGIYNLLEDDDISDDFLVGFSYEIS